MDHEGPLLETLTRRLAETPPDFLDEPRIAEQGRVHVSALVNDVLFMHGARPSRGALAAFESAEPKADRNRLMLVMIASWFLADEWFVRAGLSQDALLSVLNECIADLAAVTQASKFTTDAERREEFARVVLSRIGFRPTGESPTQAQDRLMSVSTSERKRLIAASRETQQRARSIREALAKKAAEESADKWTRE